MIIVSHGFRLVKETRTVLNTAAPDAAVNDTNEKVIFKNCAPLPD